MQDTTDTVKDCVCAIIPHEHMCSDFHQVVCNNYSHLQLRVAPLPILEIAESIIFQFLLYHLTKIHQEVNIF